MKKKYITVLLEYTEPENDFTNKLTNHFRLDKKIDGCRIIAMSLEDEFKRIEELEATIIANDNYD